MGGILLATIHNNDTNRNGMLFPAVEGLRNALSARWPAVVTRVSYQPDPATIASGPLLMRNALAEGAALRDMARYYERSHEPVREIARAAAYFVKAVLGLGGWRQSSDKQRREKRRVLVESVLSDKHIRCWAAFLESDSQYLIVFEDDAIFRDDSAIRLKDLLATLDQLPEQRTIYADLAGGFPIEQLRLDAVRIQGQIALPGMLEYRKVATNTTCCYLLNRPMASALYNEVLRRPLLRLIGPGWMISTIAACRSDIHRQRGAFLLTDPTLFLHGTASGVFKSSIGSQFC
jgi:hypothetical protein